MPPKKRGQNIRGRDKIFRNAVQHVHVGIGHNVLGNILLQPIATSLLTHGDGAEQEEQAEVCAFLLELNELMLSHSTTDFRRFRWEVLPLCESKALFQLNHRKIAEKLLLALLSRDKYAEGFEAFVRLTVAFARDLREKFLTYFECFHKTVNGGIFDASGQLLADTRRLQLVFSAQVAWCREMRPYLLLPDQRKLVERVICLYVRQMHDTKEYIRRLCAEVLAALCRSAQDLIPLVVEVICLDVLQDFEAYCVAADVTGKHEEEFDGDENESGEDGKRFNRDNSAIEAKEEEEEVSNVKEGTTVSVEDGVTERSSHKDSNNKRGALTSELLFQYEQQRLASLPVVDGMCFLSAELFRGIRGAVSTNFENYYALLTHVFGLSRCVQFEGTHSAGYGTDERERFGYTEEDIQHFIHSSKWKEMFTSVQQGSHAANEEDAIGDEVGGKRCTVRSELIQHVGAIAVGTALRTVAEEISASPAVAHTPTNGSSTALQQLLGAVTALLEFSVPHTRVLASLLHAADHMLLRDATALPLLRRIVRTLQQQMTAQQERLQRRNVDRYDVHDWELFLRTCGAVLELATPLCVGTLTSSTLQLSCDTYRVKLQRLFLPLARAAVQISLSVADPRHRDHTEALDPAATTTTSTSSVGDGVYDTMCCLREPAKMLLFAFVQDILQKSYAFCLRDERRITEEEEDDDDDEQEYDDDCCGDIIVAKGTKKHNDRRVLKSYLTPLGFALLAPILQGACVLANTALEHLNTVKSDTKGKRNRNSTKSCGAKESLLAADDGKWKSYAYMMRDVKRAVMLARMMNDRTANMAASPLFELLVTVPNLPSGESVSLQSDDSRNTSDFSFAIDRATLTRSLQMLLLTVTAVYADAQRAGDVTSLWRAGKWADVVSAVLPLVVTVAEAECAIAKGVGKSKRNTVPPAELSFVRQYRSTLLHVMGCVKAAVSPSHTTTTTTTTTNNNNSGAIMDSVGVDGNCGNSTLTPFLQLTAASYSLFAQASALLVQLTTLGAVSHVRHVESECVGFLKDAVTVLAASFHKKHVKSFNDEETARLLHGMESLLFSLLHLFGVELERDAEANASLHERAEKKAKRRQQQHTSKKKSMEQSSSEVSRPQQEKLMHAISRLHTALDAQGQRELVQTLLFEALASPVPSLRVVALRLLRLLCHPEIAVTSSTTTGVVTERTAGCRAVDPVFFTALLRAELFNPLSATGNLDGVKQALAKLSFDAAAGKIRDPLQRVILARAMIGLLHKRYADAWPVALKILTDLVRMEDTSLLTVQRLEKKEEVELSSVDDDHTLGAKMEPLVWHTVVCRYAHAVVFGDIVHGVSSPLYTAVDTETVYDADDDDGNTNTNSNDDCNDETHEVVLVVLDMENVRHEVRKRVPIPVWYRIRLSDMQRHEKGELVSKDFSTACYTNSATTITLLQLANADNDVLSWQRHYLPSASPTSAYGALTARSTDRPMLAKTFLSGLAEITRGAIAMRDARATLMMELVLELVAVRRGEHPSGVRQLKLLDDRLILAMNASCGTVISTTGPSSTKEQIPAEVREVTMARAEQLQCACVSFLSDTNAKLQRVAVEQLKRLKVSPFVRYYAQLLPYCDTQQNLFHFLETFHVDTDVSTEDAADYIATALVMALPKLTAKVPREKMRDHAVLQRRVLTLVTHLTDGDALAAVLEGLVRRLVFEQLASNTTMKGKETEKEEEEEEGVITGKGIKQKSAGLVVENKMPAAVFGFSAWWMEWVQKEHHCGRRLERLLKQLLSTIQLITVLLQAVGRAFAAFTPTCLHLALNAYLVACKQTLRLPLNDLERVNSTSTSVDENEDALNTEVHRRVHAVLSSATINTLLPRLRRSATVMIASLFEQFPKEVMTTLRNDILTATVDGDVRQTVMGRYVAVLQENNSGALPELLGAHRGDDGKQQTAVTPLLRLVRAWISSPETMPLVGFFDDAVTATFQQLFAINTKDNNSTINNNSKTSSGTYRALTTARSGSTAGRIRTPQQQAATLSVYEGLRCMTAILASSDEPLEMFGTKRRTTLRKLFVEPHVMTLFESLYRLIICGTPASTSTSSFFGTERVTGVPDGRQSSAFMITFSVSMWKEMIATVTMLAEYVASARTTQISGNHESVDVMLGKLLQMCIAFVTHPASAKDRQTCITAIEVLEQLLPRVPRVDPLTHYEPIVRLFNAVTTPEARLALSRVLTLVLQRLTISPSRHVSAQLAAVGRAVVCLNSFAEENTELERYDFELRFHTFRSLLRFFQNAGNYNTPGKKRREAVSHTTTTTTTPSLEKRALEEGAKANDNDDNDNKSTHTTRQVRKERDYSGLLDVTIPLHDTEAPVLCVEAFTVLTANVVFFLRDPENTIRALAQQLLHAMMFYATRQSTPVPSYDTLILERVVRHELLPSLRRGVTSRDVHIRHTHMQCFGVLAQYYPTVFPSFAALYARNIEQNFFANVGHVQHRCRLNALAQLRQNVSRLQPRDVLRVFVPFLLTAVKDFAQGKRDLQNLTEGRAKGYCSSLLMTVAALAAALPWEGYYRILSLLLLNARENVSLRLPMLRGVVMVLDHFHFLNEEEKVNVERGDVARRAAREPPQSPTTCDNTEEDDDEGNEDEDETAARAAAALRAKRLKYRNARVMHILEDDILPQLYEFLSDGSRKNNPVGAEFRGNVHSITSVRSEMRKSGDAQQNTALLHLPVAIAITKIVKRFPHERFSTHAEHLLDEVVLKLRTKNDKHRESARRVLSAMLCETGPGKLGFVITKLRDHLVHGYQLHVLGYTVVTLLYNLYEPHHIFSYGHGKAVGHNKATASRGGKSLTIAATQENTKDEPEEELESNERENEEEEDEEEELARQLAPASVRFDYAYGVECLTASLDDLMGILLDDYLGEVGEQKEQVELMSTMVEVKRNRAPQGFTLLASHCKAERVIETFLQKITWLLTPPNETMGLEAHTNTRTHRSGGGARAGAMLLMNELKNKYSTVSKNAMADFGFVQKVRLLAVRVARALITNATMEVEGSFNTVRVLLQRHNDVREAKIRAFEAKDGTRRVRGNTHMLIHRSPVETLKSRRDANFLVAPRPERVDVDFSVHTVLATQQKQKLRAYRGRYGKELQQASKDFYREDPTTAVVLDTLDEFLLKYLLSVLKQVLGIGKERKYSTAAVRLDLLRMQKRKKNNDNNSHNEKNGDTSVEDTKKGEEEEAEEEEDNSMTNDAGGEVEDATLDLPTLDDDEGDALDHFADEAQEVVKDIHEETGTKGEKESKAQKKKRRPIMPDLTASFTREHQQLLEDLVPVVLTTLQGEGSDAVVGNALDCMLALVSLRPPLRAVGTLHTSLYDTVTAFFERGGVIKQRAMRVAAAVVSHQRFTMTDEQASRLTRLCHAELVERNEFAPMALVLFHAVLGKHAHVVEVYELIGLVTELMMHTSAKRLMRQRCIAVMARFLTEYRMTPTKFRSHMDLLCRNLDYPSMTGRLAILELLAVLTHRLPTAVLRDEAPVLLLSLATTLATAPHPEVRERAGDVLKQLVRNAGVDVLAPTLTGWLAETQTRKMRAMALQVWAIMIPAIASAYDVTNTDEAQQFAACCQWSLPAVMVAALYDQVAASGTKRRHEELSVQLKRKLQLRSWTYVFFALRCVEAMFTATAAASSTDKVWLDTTAIQLIPCIVNRLITHTHPWIQAVALRLMRMYCHGIVEPRCGYMSDEAWDTVGLAKATRKHKQSKNKGAQEEKHVASRNTTAMPFVVYFRDSSVPDTSSRALEALEEIVSALRALFQYISLSDVPNEKYTAHRAIQHPSRTDTIAVALYLTRAMTVISAVLLVSASRAGESVSHLQDVLGQYFTSLCRHLHSLSTPLIKHGTVANVMVRTTSIVQYFGGFLATIPTPPNSTSEALHCTGRHDTIQASCRETVSCVDAALRWLLNHAIGLSFIKETIVPTITIAMGSSHHSEQICTFATQACAMLREQLELHRRYFTGYREACKTQRHKRSRLEQKQEQQQEKEEGEEEEENRHSGPTVDDVLFALTAEAAALRHTRKETKMRREATKLLRKRSRSAVMGLPKTHKHHHPQEQQRRKKVRV